MNRTARIVFSLFIASMIFYIMGWRAALATFIVTYFAAPPLLGASNKWVKRVPMLISLFLIICCFLLAYPGPAGDNRYKRAKAWTESTLVDLGVLAHETGTFVRDEAKDLREVSKITYGDRKEHAGRAIKGQAAPLDEVCMKVKVSPGSDIRTRITLNYELDPEKGARVSFWNAGGWTEDHHVFYENLNPGDPLREVGPYKYLTNSWKAKGPDNGSTSPLTAPWGTSARRLIVDRYQRFLVIEATGDGGTFTIGIKVTYTEGKGPTELPTHNEVGVDSIDYCG